MAANTDKFKKLARKWVGSIGAGGVADGTVTTIPLSSSSGLPTDTAVVATIDRVDANGVETPSLEESVVGVVSGDNLVTCTRGAEGTAQAHSAGAVVEILVTAKGWNDMVDGFLAGHSQLGAHTTDTISEKTEDAGVTVDGLKMKDGRVAGWDGWMPAEETWTYSSWDSTVYTGVITVPSGAASKYSAGMRIKISQSTGGTKYGIITKVADTALTVFFGTDYTLNNEAISNPYYSTQKAPLGFPLDPTKWTVEVVDANQRATSNPSDGVWYNATSIDIPVGCWEVEYKAVGNFRETANVAAIFALTLSTANNSESDNRFSYNFNIGILANPSQVMISMSLPRNPLALSSKTTYYLNYSIGGSGIDFARVRGDSIPTIIRAICAYL